MMNVEYKYQDTADKKIDIFKNNCRNWENSERKIIIRMKKLISTHVKSNNSRLLDAGCGQGRLLPEFQDLFGAVTAVEPDRDRFFTARQLVADNKLDAKIQMKNIKIQQLTEDDKYDVIICSHVLQHVSLQSFNEIALKLKRILKPSGLLFLTVSHSTIDHEYFEIVNTGCDRDEWDIVSREEFDKAECVNKMLPVRHFTIDDIKRYFSSFEIIDYRVFHVYPAFLLLEEIINRYPSLQTIHGTDMYVAARLK